MLIVARKTNWCVGKNDGSLLVKDFKLFRKWKSEIRSNNSHTEFAVVKLSTSPLSQFSGGSAQEWFEFSALFRTAVLDSPNLSCKQKV